MTSRRALLKTIGLFLFFIFSGNGNAAAQLFFSPRKKKAPRISKNLFIEGGKALVGVAGKGAGGDVKKTVREAVSLIGGFERLKLKGRTVLVKPNVVSGEPNPATTNPGVVAAVVKILYEEGAGKVYVGDMSAFATLSTKRNMARNGIKKAAEDNGAEVVIFEDHDWVEVPLTGTKYVKKAHVTEWLYATDVVVNLPVIKTHRRASYSITLKNFIGCTHLKERPYIIDASHWEEIVAEFNTAYSPDLNIVDGTVSMIEGGPWEGTTAETNIIIASGDRIGADIAGLGVIKYFGKWEMVAGKDVWAQRQIKTALDLGVGRAKDGLRLVTGEGDERFKELMRVVREETGL